MVRKTKGILKETRKKRERKRESMCLPVASQPVAPFQLVRATDERMAAARNDFISHSTEGCSCTTARTRARVVDHLAPDPETQAPLLRILVGAHRHASRVYISTTTAAKPSLAPQYPVSRGWDSFPIAEDERDLRIVRTSCCILASLAGFFSWTRTVSRAGAS